MASQFSPWPTLVAFSLGLVLPGMTSSASADEVADACDCHPTLLTDFEWLDSNKHDRDLHTLDLSAFLDFGVAAK